MNGRVYDYNLGRFMSVDPFIQSPTSTQSVNPYSYIMNNPLSGTDPTGYVASRWRTSACDLDDSCPKTPVDRAMAKYLSPHIQSGQKNETRIQRRRDMEDSGKETIPTNISNAEVQVEKSAGATHKIIRINKEWQNNGNVKVNSDGTIQINLTVSGFRNEYAASEIENYWNGSSATIDGKEYTINENVISVRTGGDIRINKMSIRRIKRLEKKTGGKMPGGYADFGSSKMELTIAAKNGTAAHEFGHMLGISHAPEDSGSIMSYDADRNVTDKDIDLIIKGYAND